VSFPEETTDRNTRSRPARSDDVLVSIVKDQHSFPDGLCRAAEGRSLRSELPAFCPVNKSSGDRVAPARWDALRRRLLLRASAMPISAETGLRKRTIRIDPSGLAITSFLHGSLIGRFKRLPDSANPSIPSGPKRGSKSRPYDTHVHVFGKGFFGHLEKYFSRYEPDSVNRQTRANIQDKRPLIWLIWRLCVNNRVKPLNRVLGECCI
jgi:hypothetical protein